MSASTPKAIQVASNDEIKALGFDDNRLQRVREKIVSDILQNIKSLQLSPSVLEELVQNLVGFLMPFVLE